MRKLLSTLAISVTLAGAGVAQEANWDRWFVGFDAGYIGRETWNSAEGQFNYSGFSAGISAGKWWTLDNVVVGFDLGATLGGTAYRRTISDLWWTGSVEIDEVFSSLARMKVGVPLGEVLPYIAVGPQYVHSKTRVQYSFQGIPSEYTEWETSFGAVAAAGVETLVSPNFALKAEAGLNLAFPNFSSPSRHIGWSARVGANYYFD